LDELPGVFGGRVSSATGASSAVIRSSASDCRANNVAIGASFLARLDPIRCNLSVPTIGSGSRLPSDLTVARMTAIVRAIGFHTEFFAFFADYFS